MGAEDDARENRRETRENSVAIGNLAGRVGKLEERADTLRELRLIEAVPELRGRMDSAERKLEELLKAKEESGTKLQALRIDVDRVDGDVQGAKRLGVKTAWGLGTLLLYVGKQAWEWIKNGGLK